MADLKVTNPQISDLLALQKAAAVYAKKVEGPRQTEATQADGAVRVDVNPRIQKLAEASPPTELAEGKPTITEQAAKQLALDVGQNLKNTNLSFAGGSEKTILGLFG